MIGLFQEQNPAVSLEFLCQKLEISRSWFYEQSAASTMKTTPHPNDVDLRHAIETIALETIALETIALETIALETIALEFPCYGYRRITAQLARDGWIGELAVNHKRVLKIMQEESLLCHLKKRFVTTTDSRHGRLRTAGTDAYGQQARTPTDSRHGRQTYPNCLKEILLNRPDQAWVADITYIRLPTGFCYLASILDAFSRRCIGWHLSCEIDTRLTLAALEMGIRQRKPAAGLIHHSDRGVQYASGDYVARLEQASIQPSMSAKGNPYDNAKAESFFKTLKKEEVYLKDYQNYAEAQSNVSSFIESVYYRVCL